MLNYRAYYSLRVVYGVMMGTISPICLIFDSVALSFDHM